MTRKSTSSFYYFLFSVFFLYLMFCLWRSVFYVRTSDFILFISDLLISVIWSLVFWSRVFYLRERRDSEIKLAQRVLSRLSLLISALQLYILLSCKVVFFFWWTIIHICMRLFRIQLHQIRRFIGRSIFVWYAKKRRNLIWNSL